MIDNTYMNYSHNLINISNTKRRRSFDVRSDSSQETEWSKRVQHVRIHTELHTYTVETMMKSQRLLQERERLQKAYNVDEEEDIKDEKEIEVQSNYTQSPFWPVLNKVTTK